MSERRHEPTPTRLRRARRDGDVAVSHDLANAISLAGGFVLLGILASPLALTLMQLARAQFQAAAAPLSDGLVVSDHLAEVANAALPLFAALVAVGWFAQGVQRGFRWNATPLSVDWQRLDPNKKLQSVGRDGASQAIICVKLLLLLLLVGALLWNEIPNLLNLGELPALGVTVTLSGVTLRLAATLSFALMAVGGLDYLWQRYRYRRRLRMTSEELREEWKQEEGGKGVRKRRR